MAYATVSEITSEFKDIRFDVDTPITSDEVEQFINEESSFIDAYISSVYVTPIDEVTQPLSFLVLKKIARARTAYRIKLILKVKTGNAGVDQEVRAFSDESMKWLSKIKSGEIQLGDALLADDSSLRSFNAENGIEPFFDVKKQQW